MKRVKDLAKKTYQKTKNNLPKPVFWSVPALLAAVALALLYHLLTDQTVKPTTAKDAAKATVEIANRELTSGGTGVVIESSRNGSTILTNGHVCGVVQNGGVVVADTGHQYIVTGYKKSKLHDLCLVTVAANLRVDTKLASSAPDDYAYAMVSGHPSLLPTVVTEGHFSSHMIVQVLTEITPCKEEDFKNEPLMCLFFGGIPKITTYEAQLVTATIQPGSSGSAVYNSSGELSALVFAGSGQIGYAVVVPYEFVAEFLKHEQYTLQYSRPEATLSVGSKKESNKNTKSKSIAEISNDCANKQEAKENPEISKVCQIFDRDMIQH